MEPRIEQSRREDGRIVRKARFTLVEMLVVIAIIGIMASLLLPALDDALHSARRTSCLNQMRQTGIEIIQYAETYYGRAPLYYDWGDRQRSSVLWEVTTTGTPDKAGFTALGKLYYAGLMRPGQTYYCPVDTGVVYNNRNMSTSNYNQWPPGRWGEAFCPPSGTAWANSPTRISYGTRPVVGSPSAFSGWVNAEVTNPPKLAKYTAKAILSDGVSNYSVSRKHRSGTNIIRGDGSGRWIMLDTFYANALAGGGDNNNWSTINNAKILSTDSAGNDSGVWADFDKAR